jgi:hypothetical protein
MARHGSSSIIIYRASGAHAKGRRRGMISGISLYLQGQWGHAKGRRRGMISGISLYLYLSVSTPFPLTYKRGTETPRRGEEKRSESHSHSHTPQETWEPSPSLAYCNPYFKLSARAQAARIGRTDIMPELVQTLVSFLHTIRARRTITKFTSWQFETPTGVFRVLSWLL